MRSWNFPSLAHFRKSSTSRVIISPSTWLTSCWAAMREPRAEWMLAAPSSPIVAASTRTVSSGSAIIDKVPAIGNGTLRIRSPGSSKTSPTWIGAIFASARIGSRSVRSSESRSRFPVGTVGSGRSGIARSLLKGRSSELRGQAASPRPGTPGASVVSLTVYPVPLPGPALVPVRGRRQHGALLGVDVAARPVRLGEVQEIRYLTVRPMDHQASPFPQGLRSIDERIDARAVHERDVRKIKGHRSTGLDVRLEHRSDARGGRHVDLP